MYAYVFSGTEKNDQGECPLYQQVFSSANAAKIYAHQHFYLRDWREIKSGVRWEIVTAERTYLIERRKVKRDDIKH